MINEWHSIISINEIELKDVTEVRFHDLTLAVYDTDHGITVSDARCTHAGANLCDGYFDGKHIECPLHQGLFDVQTGVAKAAPVTRAIKMYPTRVFQGNVQIMIHFC